MGKTIDLELLQIETTNRCNLNCEHCMLYEDEEVGTDYNDYITKKVIDNFFDKMNIRMIATLNFTGGEPLLNIDAIIYTIEKIIKEKMKVIVIDIATNGTILSENLIDALNKFADYSKKEVVVSEETNTPLVTIRISRMYHNNDCEKAYEFYSKRVNELISVEMESKDAIIPKKIKWGVESRPKMAYSGRAKNLDVEYYCDSPRHKIIYSEKTKDFEVQSVKCPIKLMTNGDIGIACYCTLREAHKNAIGNVNNDMCLADMITQWNFRTPLTCSEACKLEECKMYYETKRLDDFSRIFGEEITIDDLENMLEKEKTKCAYLENYRILLHDKIPCLTSDEIEWVSNLSLEYCKQSSDKSSDEIDKQIEKLVYEHSFDDVKKVHEEFPFLNHAECIELKKLYEICKTYSKNCTSLQAIHLIPSYVQVANLIKLNEYRRETYRKF